MDRVIYCFLVVLFGLKTSWATASISEKPLLEIKKLYRRSSKISYPQDNPFSEAKVQLGKILFFDPRLSGSNIISCATCHNPSLSWADSLAKGVGHGHQQLSRRTPTVLNLAWIDRFFWDGRAATLEEQALAPIQSEVEMNMKIDNLPEKISFIPGYQALFQKVFPGEPISNQQIAKAIATFERSIVSEPAPFDRWIQGNEKAISKEAKEGFKLFNGKANCVACHSGWSFTDGSFHDIGMADEDLGRGKILPKLTSMQHAFKTPTLRDVARRSPYMHNGSEKTLEDIIEFYNRGGDVSREGKSEDVRSLTLSLNEKKAIVEFLKTLTSDSKSFEVPILPN